jgi:hypothetical protein
MLPFENRIAWRLTDDLVPILVTMDLCPLGSTQADGDLEVSPIKGRLNRSTGCCQSF